MTMSENLPAVSTDKPTSWLGRYFANRRQQRIDGIAERIIVGAMANRNRISELVSDMAVSDRVADLICVETPESARQRAQLGAHASPPEYQPDIEMLNSRLEETSSFPYRIETVQRVGEQLLRPVFRFTVVKSEEAAAY